MIYRQDQHCQFCKNYHGERKCLAFPIQIPSALWTGENWHRDAYPGDQGYRFEVKFTHYPDLTQEQIEELDRD